MGEYLKKLASYKIFLSSGKDTLCQKIGESVLLEFFMNTEAEILMRASADIDKLGDQVHDVSVPKVLGFTREVLVMKRADGNHLVDLLPGGSKNKSQEEEEALKALKAQKIVRNLFQYQGASVFKSGMVHCDPHAGNILVDSDGHITVLDWGCVADLSDEEQKHLEVIFANLPHIKDAGHESKDVASSWGFLGGLCGPKCSSGAVCTCCLGDAAIGFQDEKEYTGGPYNHCFSHLIPLSRHHSNASRMERLVVKVTVAISPM